MTSGRRGFTLIETLVALVILAIGLFAMAATSAAVTTTLTGSRNATIATQLATLRMEALRATSRSTLTPAPRAALPAPARRSRHRGLQ